MGMFVAEGLSLGAIGGALGVALGYALAVALTNAGIMMPPPPTFTRGFPLEIAVVPALYAVVMALMVATLGVAAVLPAARAARLRIIDALGHV
jgi:putative ABC transport system permease protein